MPTQGCRLSPRTVRKAERTLLESLEAPGVEPVFPEKDQAINYAENRTSFRSGEMRILDSAGNVERTIHFTEADRKM
jgi:hypothetical protein